MRNLENENNPLILKELIKLIVADNDKKQQLIDKLLEQKAKSDQQSFSLEESLLVLRKKFFGSSSEKMTDRARSQKTEDPELILHAQNLLPPHKPKSARKLPEEVVVHEASAQDLVLASTELGLANPSADQWEKIAGLFDESTEIEIIERSYKRLIHKRQKYKLKSVLTESEKESVLISAEGPTKLLPGCGYSNDFAVSSVVDKYLNHLPLERQCRMMDSLGLMNMKPQILYNLARIISVYLEPLVEKIKKEILQLKCVHADETTWPINNAKDSDGYMWVISNSQGSYYQYEPTRSGKVIKEILEDYSGCIMTDGYSGYYQYRAQSEKNVNKNKLSMCHAHARRYFFEIKEEYPEVEAYLLMYQELFLIEKLAKDFAELEVLRQQRSKPVLEKMRLWLLDQYPKARAESKLKSAIEYTTKHWNELTVFLTDVNVPLTNNEAERTIRQAVMGRKNFYGSRSINGADVTAIMYTIIESCKKLELDPRNYLLETIRLCAQHKEAKTPFEFAKSLRQ